MLSPQSSISASIAASFLATPLHAGIDGTYSRVTLLSLDQIDWEPDQTTVPIGARPLLMRPRAGRCRVFVITKMRLKMSKERDPKQPRGRLGRPPKDLAGDVKGRILDAAQEVFLKRGFQSASIDEIAVMAPASKPTIYAHFPGKEALFSAVVARVINGLTNFRDYVPKGRTVQDKLTSLGTEIVERFIEDTLDVT